MKPTKSVNVQLLTKQIEEQSKHAVISARKKITTSTAASAINAANEKNIKSSNEANHQFLIDLVSKKLEEVKSFLRDCKSDQERLKDNHEKQNIYIIASIFNRLDIITVLMNEYPKLFKETLNHTDSRGFTALSWACYRGHADIVAFLIKAGANVFIPDHFGYTSLRLAFVARNVEIINLLAPISKLTKMPGNYAQYISDCKFIKWIGHGLGLNAYISMISPANKNVLVQTDESTTKLNELNLFSYLLHHYINHLKIKLSAQNSHTIKYFELILKANKITIDYHRLKNKVTAETLATQFATEITIIPAGSNFHEIGLVLYKNRAILCDRGSFLKKLLGAGTTVFTILNKANITPAFIESLYPKPFAGMEIESLYIKLFDEKAGILSENNIVAKFDTKSQKFSTCSYSNLKSTLPGILYLLRYEQIALGKNKSEELKLTSEAKTYAHDAYKAFSLWSREYLIDYFSEKAKSAYKLGSPNKELYFSLGQALLAEHHGQHRPYLQYDRSTKRQQELKRAQKLSLTLYQINPVKAKELAENLKAQGVKPSALTSILNPS